jgi:hypothetical protein
VLPGKEMRGSSKSSAKRVSHMVSPTNTQAQGVAAPSILKMTTIRLYTRTGG